MVEPSPAVEVEAKKAKEAKEVKEVKEVEEGAAVDGDGDLEVLSALSPAEEAQCLAQAARHKAEANALFGRGQLDDAITAYEHAAAALPPGVDYDYDRAVLDCNTAACHVKASAWADVVSAATAALAALDRVDKAEADKKEAADKEAANEDEADVEEEIVSPGAAQAARLPSAADLAAAAAHDRARDRARIRAKALFRRARARAALGGWANLSGAEQDFQAVLTMETQAPGSTALTAADRQVVRQQLQQLPARVKAAQETEMTEVWGKLKELGNGILRPFGLSTTNFNMVKDEQTGGYSMNFKPNE